MHSQLGAVERLASLQYTEPDTSSTKGTNNLALKVVSVLGDLSYVPVPSEDLLVADIVVSDENEDLHDNVFCHRDDIRASNLGDQDLAFVSGIQVYMVGATCVEQCLKAV